MVARTASVAPVSGACAGPPTAIESTRWGALVEQGLLVDVGDAFVIDDPMAVAEDVDADVTGVVDADGAEGGSLVAPVVTVLPYLGDVVWTARVVGPMRAWMLWYVTCSVSTGLAVQRSVTRLVEG